MGIYIKDMDMPTYCEACPLCYQDYSLRDFCGINSKRIWEDKPDWCPLIFIEDKDEEDNG